MFPASWCIGWRVRWPLRALVGAHTVWLMPAGAAGEMIIKVLSHRFENIHFPPPSLALTELGTGPTHMVVGGFSRLYLVDVTGFRIT